MKFLKFIFPLFSFFALFGTHVNAQNLKSFTPDSITFVSELSDFFISARKKEGEEFMLKEFIPVFYSGRFSEADKQVIYKTCNIMLKKRMKPFPDFKNYLSTMINFLDAKQSVESFEAWQRSLEKIIEKSTSKRFVDFLAFSENIFSSNIIYKTSNVTWYSDNNNYIFEYDSLPYVVFPSLNLKCESKDDSTVIYGTSGILYPLEDKWIGKGGKVNWVRAGFPENEIHAELNKYEIGLKTAAYTADSVSFYNSQYFSKPILGKLQDKVKANVNENNATYPRFDSYHKRFLIKNIIDGVNYDGGFSMVGPKFIGMGSDQENAMLIFYRNDNPFLVAESKVFVIRQERITSDRASITVFLENDSIFHPGLNMKLLTKERELVLYRDDKGIAKSPYFNTFHSIDMDVEVINWKIDEPLMNMGVIKGSTQTYARFESSNYYSYSLYQKILGMDAVHPLVLIREVSKKFQSREIMAEDIVSHMRLPMSQVSPMLLNLANQGFLQYDIERQLVIIKDKLFWYLDANAEKRDYDVIEFNSDISGKANATLNLLNYDLTIRGVSQIFLSDSQNVFIQPSKREITLKKNRDFIFGGVVNAGLFDFYGKQFSFEYETFKINLIAVDSLSIKVKVGQKDEYGRQPMIRVKTVIEDIQGDLLIDGPKNKSGLKSLANYPVLNSRKESFVYYNSPSIQMGAYNKEKFYFKVDPFTIDSLNSFENASLRFKGLFVSAGIFPDFQEDLTLQADYSLGFIRKAPPGGYPVYGNKAVFENDIKMSHEGLKGDGTLNYITSKAHSNNFIFYPDSTNALMNQYTIAERNSGVEYPAVAAAGAYMHFMPFKDIMEVEKRNNPLVMFNGQAESHGKLFLEPSGLTGEGLMTFNNAEMDAKEYKYKFNEFFSDTADFRLASLSSAEFALKTINVNAHVNFAERKAKFISNGGGSLMEFPSNQYVCFMDQFTWLMDKNDIELTGGKSQANDPGSSDLDLTGSQFISIHPKQDSLSYFSPKTRYDLKENVIYSSQVKYFNVADAMIYPGDGEVVVEKKAKMRTLENAKIKANYITQYHTLYNSTVNVEGKRKYTASGDYDYVDENKVIQTIHFNEISPDTTGQTSAEGIIEDAIAFKLSPYFEFTGNVKLEATKQHLSFDGTSRIIHGCEMLSRNWMKFNAEIDPMEIYIPVAQQPVNEDNYKLASGLLLANDSVGIYSSYLSKKLSPKDINVIGADGFLFYDKASKEYRISNREKLKENMLTGNYISLNINDCKFYGEGNMDLGVDLGNITVKPAGYSTHNLNDNLVLFDVIFPMNFFFEESAMEKMAERMQKSASAQPVDYSRLVFEKSMRELLGKESADKLISELNLYGGSYRKFPSDLNHTIFFTDVKFRWEENLRSYRSIGQIGIGNIYKTQINRVFDGNIEIVKKRGGDIMNLYLDLGAGEWYFFSYQRNVMQALSSNEEFNKIIKEVKSDKRKYKNVKGEAPFQYIISTVSKKNQFLRKLENSEEQKEE
ncbi:MAG: hypothetical protein H0V01_05245 [Bacteroidetes bacterium]|nr:hypothetical protein [Bacteroidota bacterium]HET6243675.1 hypothetical protein [Bacteroidia bacterium]